jgi:hypothetical protein
MARTHIPKMPRVIWRIIAPTISWTLAFPAANCAVTESIHMVPAKSRNMDSINHPVFMMPLPLRH